MRVRVRVRVKVLLGMSRRFIGSESNDLSDEK